MNTIQGFTTDLAIGYRLSPHIYPIIVHTSEMRLKNLDAIQLKWVSK